MAGSACRLRLEHGLPTGPLASRLRRAGGGPVDNPAPRFTTQEPQVRVQTIGATSGFELKSIRAKLDAAGVAYEMKEQSIVLLERLRNPGSDPAEANHFAGLRTVQSIRSKAKGHASGRDAHLLSREALSQHGSYTNHFKHACQLVSEDLRTIEELFGARS